jgi:hypothetical protein
MAEGSATSIAASPPKISPDKFFAVFSIMPPLNIYRQGLIIAFKKSKNKPFSLFSTYKPLARYPA